MPFIEKVVNELLRSDIELSKTHIVLPGKRPIIFFKRQFIEKGYKGLMPLFLTIEDFALKYSNLVKIENIPLWCEAFQIQKKFINPNEKLEDFLKWIPTLIKDFNDIEIFSKNPSRILEHLTSIERIENWGELLDSENKKKLFKLDINFWRNNLILYKELVKELKRKGLGFSGMIFSSALENLKNISIPEDETFVFAGLNALTPKEEELIKYFIYNTDTLLYWDSDEYYMKNTKQEAGYFLRNHIKWSYYASREFKWMENQFSKPKEINVVSASQEVAQAKYISKLLQNIPSEEIPKTAIVLSDETILPSIIESLPKNIQQVNITMGYPLKNSFLASFFKQIFNLHIFREKNKSKGFYYYDILEVLQHSIVENDSAVSNFVEEIKANNLIFISDSMLYERLNKWNKFFIFKNYETPAELIRELHEFCVAKFWEIGEDNPILKENYLKFKNLLSVLISQLAQDVIIDNFSLLFTFYSHLLNNEKIDFIGEPLEGLQIMGMLETRLLDFKNVIITGVNEGIIPAGRPESSFIPFDVKKNYGLYTFLENDAIYAYHFYRLLQHADSITLLYNNFTEGLNTGEKSRFIRQLEFESNHTIAETVISYSGNLDHHKEFTLEKSPALLTLIKDWLKEPISPTHLTAYHYNPIGFYMQKILQLEETPEIEEEISALNYGNLIHHTLESLYAPLKGKFLKEKDLDILLKEYPLHLEDYIKKELNPQLFERGQNYLQKLLAEKTLEKIILRDLTDVRNGNQIFLEEIEKKITSTVEIPNIGLITLKGFIDRWDKFNGQDRIIDYKTSSITSLNFKSNKNISENKSFKFFIQLVFYAYMMLNEEITDSVQVGIWSFKKPFKGLELLVLDDHTTFEIEEIKKLFTEITGIIQEISDPGTSFVSKEKD